MRIFENQIIEGGAHMSSDGALLYVYGKYLVSGGTPEAFQELTLDDVQTMYIVMTAEPTHNKIGLLKGLNSLMMKMFGK